MDVCEVLYKDFLICIDQAKHGGSHGYIFFGRLDETLKIFPSKTTGTNALLHSTTEVHLFVCDVLYKKKSSFILAKMKTWQWYRLSILLSETINMLDPNQSMNNIGSDSSSSGPLVWFHYNTTNVIVWLPVNVKIISEQQVISRTAVQPMVSGQ